MIQALATLLLPFLVIHAVLLGVGVVTGLLLRLIFPELDLGLGRVAGVLGAGISSYLVYKLLVESMRVEEVEVPVLERMADLPYILDHRTRPAKERPPTPVEEGTNIVIVNTVGAGLGMMSRPEVLVVLQVLALPQNRSRVFLFRSRIVPDLAPYKVFD